MWGIWSIDGSPFNVWADVKIPPDSVLTIESGVSVVFMVYASFLIDTSATLLANGSPDDSISFYADDPGNGWRGMRFLSASSSSQLSYCTIEHGFADGVNEERRGGALYISSCSLSVSHCTLRDNYADYRGGAICCSNADPVISVFPVFLKWTRTA